MAVRAKSTDKRITHHISLSHGDTEIGLVLCDGRGNPNGNAMPSSFNPQTPLQISSGDSDYGSYELPYTPITQKDWSGGRGQEDFEEDKTRYADSHGVDTILGDIILGPKLVMSQYYSTPETITRAQTGTFKYSNPFTVGGDETITFGTKPNANINQVARSTRFQWTSDFDLEKITVYLAKMRSVRVTLIKCPSTMSTTSTAIFNYNSCLTDGHGNKTYGMELIAKQWFAIEYSDTLQAYTFDIPAGMDKNSYYFLTVASVSIIKPPQTDPVDIPPLFGINSSYSSSYELISVSGNFYSDGVFYSSATYWADTTDGLTGGLAFILHAAVAIRGAAHFFNYRGTLFLVTTPSTGGPPRLMYEGYHGYVNDAAWEASKLKTPGIGAEALNAKVKIIGGKGNNELTRWRTITEVASTYVSCSPIWNIAQDTTTEYAIVGTGKWKEITGHGLTKAVTSVCVVNDIVYFAMGEGTPIRRMQMINSSGMWTPQYADEPAANDANFLKLIQNEKGEKKIWRARATAATVASSDTKTWGNNLDFGDAAAQIECGNKMYRITGIEAYGNPRLPWILKEDGFGSIGNGIYDQVPLSEFESVVDDDNGRAHLQRGVYLYISMLNGLERYYNDRLDDIGPNRDLGLPNERNGKISALLAYPGRMYAAIDHPSGYSSVMVYNDTGWHEIYRTSVGARLYDLSVQVIDGDAFDRLWLVMNGSYAYLPIALDPKKQNDYQYSSSGELITSWIYGGYKETKKFFRSIKIFGEGFASGAQYARVAYQIDREDADWVEVNVDFETSPDQEALLSPDYDVAGRRMRLKISLFSNDPLKTPRIKAITVDAVTRVKQKKTWMLTFLAGDATRDLQGEREALNAKDLIDQLEDWADSDETPTPIYMHFTHELFDDQWVFIAPNSIQPVEIVSSEDPHRITTICKMAIYKA